MSGLFGSGGGNASSAPAATGIPLQTSAYGQVIALFYGRTRGSGNLIEYGNFLATPHNSAGSGGGGKGGSSGGGGKGGGGSTTFTYSATLALALGEGPIAGVGAVWRSQTESSLAGEGFGFEPGNYGQAPLAFLTALHPSTTIGYSGVAYVAGAPLQLGNSAQLPNYNFEVFGILQGTAPNGIDCDASQVVADYLTNPFYGVGFPGARLGTLATNNEGYAIPSSPFQITVAQAASFAFNLDVVDNLGNLFTCVASSPKHGQYSFTAGGLYTFAAADAGTSITIRYASLGGLTAYQNFTLASGLWISPAYTSQNQASSDLDTLATMTYAEFVWSSGALTLVPRGAVAVTGNGFSYTPNSTPLFTLTDDDFLLNSNATGTASASSNDDPVILTRTRTADQINDVRLEFLDRGNQYAASIAEVTDQALLDRFGRRTNGSATAHLFADINAANTSAQLQLQDQYIRNNYSVTLDQRYCVLDPMDVVALKDPILFADRPGNTMPVRILEITENDDGTLSFTVEEYPGTVGAAAAYSLNQGQGFVANLEADPGDINAPLIFEPSVQIATNTGLEIWCAISGANLALWGGCQVWVSSDGNTYKNIGNQVGPARMGVTSAVFPAGADPDTVDAIAVDLTESGGTLLSGTQSDADLGHTLCVVQSAGGNELVAYKTAALAGQNRYNLGAYLRRGLYGSPVLTAAAGSAFARLDTAIFIVNYDKSQIGHTIFLKFPSFNIYNGGQQPLSEVPAYSHLIQGPPPPPNVTGFVVKQNAGAVGFAWNAVTDFALKGYDILFGPKGQGIGAASFLTEAGAGTEMTNSSVPPGTWTFYIRARDIADQLSPVPATFDLVVTNPNPIIIDDFEGPAWTGTLSGLVMSWDRTLVPDSTLAASGNPPGTVMQSQGLLLALVGQAPPVQNAVSSLFTSFVPSPVTNSSYTTLPVDAGVNGALRVFSNITVELGGGQSGSVTDGFLLDTWLTGQSDPNLFTPWTIAEVDFRFLRGELALTNVAGSVGIVEQLEIVADQTAQIVDAQNNVAVNPGGTPVTFTEDFHSAPSVVVTAVGGSGLVGEPANVTATGFIAHVFNPSNGNDVGGTVNWIATGD